MFVETGAARFPYIAHTPTMRVPMAISRTDHVYLAMWAMLRAVHQHNLVEAKKIAIVACPGLGTGTGKVTPNEAARQMALAYRNYLNPPPYINWGFASERQANVRYGGDLSFHFPNA
jgi:O-acetyl-ADP-ribose deacetylase (regulator of RNase III)